ncbi:TPA: OmpH family outer membrane protein [Candidatus Spyradomonas excrementavium]|nr:OmpH family outer membrane protein [Candidatus Spyradomonas excrementavium]
MKNSKTLLVGLACLAVGMLSGGFAVSNINTEVAVVDVQKVVSASKQVNALKAEQKAKMEGLAAFVKKANEEVAAQKDEAKKKQLADKYTKELNTKKEAINKTYTEKLQAIDKNVSELIAKKAKAGGFNVVLAKGVVLYGGTDITASIAKEVK